MKKKNLVGVGLVVVLVSAALAGGFWYVRNVKKQESKLMKQEQGEELGQEVAENKVNNNSVEDERLEAFNIDNIDISNWKTYHNEEYGFEVRYPEEWEYNSMDGITFGDIKNCKRDEINEYACNNRITFTGSTSGQVNLCKPEYIKTDDLSRVLYDVVYREDQQLDGGFFRDYVFDTRKKGNNLHYVIVEYHNDTKYRSELNIINKMLSTFMLLK